MKNSIIMVLFLLGCTFAYSQELEVKLTDYSGNPIVNANIYIKNSSIHTHSNELGIFSSTVFKPGDTLTISSLGYLAREWVLQNSDFEQVKVLKLEEQAFDLNQVVVTNNIRAINQVSAIDLQTNPVTSSQEILRKVPGLFIAQHAGGGKAEQIFLRGFDIDHGTDINLTVDGLPVNMVSHAHGQGYADLHFLIPETIEKLDFGKGPYYTDKGNFATAGYVDFQTKEKLDYSLFGMEAGQFNTLRTVGLLNLLEGSANQNAYLAGEYLVTDGPFESSQHFNRINLMGKYTANLANDGKLSVLVSHFQSKWDASGQIPQRAIDQGLITRFGAIDDTEGGYTSRTNFALVHNKAINRSSFVKTRAYFSKYNFELFSNFTFFLENPESGDQIKQQESRNIAGFESSFFKESQIGQTGIDFQAGAGFRYDDVEDNALSNTLNRQEILNRIVFGNVHESNFYGFINSTFEFGKVMINPGVRVDYFIFDYVDQLAPTYNTITENKAFASPKLNITYSPNQYFQFYAKSGIGFHSNDTRVVVAQQGKEILPAAFGVDLGTIWKPMPRLWVNTALWHLFLEQEFVYVGDAGIVEPSGKTRRMGVDFGFRYQLTNWLFADADVNYTYARALNEPEGSDFIPLAPDLTSTGGLAIHHPSGISGGIRYRYIKDRPANEDGSITALGYFVTDANIDYTLKGLTFGVSVNNLFDVDWNEAQFATESRLRNESESVEELHFTPGTPFFAKARVMYRF